MDTGVVFDGRRYHVVAGARAPHGRCDADHRRVDALGAAAGEEDLGRAGVEGGRDLEAGAIDGGLGAAADAVEAAGVAELGPEEGKHGVPRLGADLGGGGVVEVDHV